MSPTVPAATMLFLSPAVLAQDTAQPSSPPPATTTATTPTTPTGPTMVGVPADSQPLATPGTTQQPAGPAPGGGGTAPQGPFGSMQFIYIMVGVMGLMIVMQMLTGRKEKKRRQEMLSSMKKGDRVQTSGGIIGTIQEVYDDEMVLRLEEGRVRVSRGAVQGVIKESRTRPEDQSPEVVVRPGREKASV